jgi:hypothetical protein
MVPDLFSMEILQKQLFQGMFCFLFPSFILGHGVPLLSFFPACLMWDSGFYVFPPLGFSLFPYFSFGIHVSTFSLFIFLGL